MAKLAGDVKYSDLFEWQLYNAALIGMGWDGKAYFYNNPLESHGQVQRLPWYQVPCCPSNLSRTFANLQNDILAVEEDKVSILQYISSAHTFQVNHQDVIFEIESALPWSGEVRLNVRKAPKGTLQLSVRQPAWTTNLTISLNDNTIQTITHPKATSLDLTRSRWIDLSRAWQEGDRLTLNFTLPIQLYVTHKRVKSVLGKAALTCGALVFCLESLDNPDVDIFNVVLNPETLTSEFNENLLGGCRMINALSTKDQILTFIPYHLWGNRGRSEMSVFVKVQG